MNTLDSNSNFLGLDEKTSNYENSEIVILSAPFEKTVSYGKGTASGPKEILKASQYIEFFDEEIHRELCFEKGIASLLPLSFENESIEVSLKQIYNSVKSAIKDGKFVITLGGEHSLSSAPIRAHFEQNNNISILQFDAHSDLRDEYEGSKYSHASVMARVAEFTTNIVQVGIRAQEKKEFYFAQENNIKTFYIRQIRENINSFEWMKSVLENLSEDVYITFDVDCFDPSLLPATGTPEPGGLFWDETMNLLKLIGEERNIVGFDVVELAPTKHHVASNFITAKLVYKMLNYAYYKKA